MIEFVVQWALAYLSAGRAANFRRNFSSFNGVSDDFRGNFQWGRDVIMEKLKLYNNDWIIILGFSGKNF